MKSPKKGFVPAIALLISLAVANRAKAQIAEVNSANEGSKIEKSKKINVSFQITPSVKEFKAGLTETDSANLKFQLWFCNAEERKISVHIYSKDGTLFSKVFNQSWYSQIYDLSGLDDGIYDFEISNGKETFKKSVEIITNSYVIRRKIIY